MSEIKHLVERALEESQANRDSDRHLVLRVWELQGATLSPEFREWFLHNALFPDSITRARRYYQELGKYPASEPVDNARFEKYLEHKEGYIPI